MNFQLFIARTILGAQDFIGNKFKRTSLLRVQIVSVLAVLGIRIRFRMFFGLPDRDQTYHMDPDLAPDMCVKERRAGTGTWLLSEY